MTGTTPDSDQPPIYLTTREAADLLRVKERKVYDLAAADEIPHRRITGKLLFPRTELFAWIEQSGNAGATRAEVVGGSHDPLLAWAVGECGCGLATHFDGSRTGLDAFAAGRVCIAGMHIAEGDGWNTGTVQEVAPRDAVLIGFARRSRGLITAPGLGNPVHGLGELRGRRVVRRQDGAGATTLLLHLLARNGIDADTLTFTDTTARTESEAAAMLSEGAADVALGLETVARSYRLNFSGLVWERYDLLMDRRAYFTPPVQALVDFTRTDTFQHKAAAMGGYDLSVSGQVMWLSP